MNKKTFKNETYGEMLTLDGKEACYVEFKLLDEPYFQLTLEFPNGSKRSLYISYNALELKQKAAQNE